MTVILSTFASTTCPFRVGSSRNFVYAATIVDPGVILLRYVSLTRIEDHQKVPYNSDPMTSRMC